MKKLLSMLLTVCLVAGMLVAGTTVSVSASSVVEDAISWAITIANDNSHGYSQSVRWGPDYDCSSFVISAFKSAGVDTGSATYTGNMRSQFTRNNDFEWIPWSQIGGVSNLRRGDILLNEVSHTEIYLGNNQNVGAHSNRGYPQLGDQTGTEVSVSGYYYHPWDGILRYKGGDVCNCTTGYAGEYIVTTNSQPLTMRSGHSTGSSAITSIPKGEQVYVSKADGSWAHVEWNGYVGYCSMQYLTKKATHADTPTIKWWVADSEYGDIPDLYKVGNRYWFCYSLYDSVSGKNWNEVANDNYTIRIAFYNPDGSLKYDSTYNNEDESWISSFFDTPGTYKYSVEVTGDYIFSGSRNFTVQDNPKKIHASASSVTLNLNGTSSQTIYTWSSGYYNGSTVFNWKRSNSNVSCEWGDWNSEDKLPLTITAQSPGSSTVTLSIKDKETDVVIDSIVVNVNVSENTKPTGSISSTNNLASSQTVTLNLSDNYGVAGYYWGTNSSYSSNSYYSVSGSSKSTSSTKTVSSSGTYYLNVKDTSGNVSNSTSVVFYKTTLNANGGSVSTTNVITKSGNSFTPPTPTRSGYVFKGWATSSSATSGSTSITPSGNNTYYAIWKADTISLSAGSTNSASITSGGEVKYYTFTPSTAGVYVIYSTGTEDTKVYLYSSSGTELASNDDVNGSGNRNFRLEYVMSAGSTYKFGVKYYDSTKTGTIPFNFGEVYSVSYNANGGKGAPAVQYKDYGTNISLSSTKPTRTGYTFLGWSTSSTATSATYQAEGSFTRDADTTLYAVWKANTYTVRYNANGGSGSMSNSTHTYDVSKVLTSNGFSKSGYTFLGWSTSSSATTATYTNGQSVKNLTASNGVTIDLYAVWSKIPTYTISYNANGGTGAPADQTKTKDISLTLSSTVPTRTGYTFLGWSTSSTATSATYQAGSSFTRDADTALYAVWKANTYTVRYNSNGGSGSMSNSTHTYDVSKVLTSNRFSKSGYTFLGWSTSSSATTATYTNGQSVKNLTSTNGATVDLYAVWSKIEPEFVLGDVNNDGFVDAGDAVLISRYDAGIVTLTSTQLKVGDVNNDGFVDAGDAVVISRYDAGFINKLG